MRNRPLRPGTKGLARSGRIDRHVRIRARNPKRRAKTFVRAYESSERVEFVKAMPCLVLGCARRDIENAHIRGDGASRKADAKLTVPLCRGHHRTRADSLHQLQPRAFEQQHHLNLEAEAARVEALWRAVTPSAGAPAGAKP